MRRALLSRDAEDGPRRAHLSCGNQAHAYAAMGGDKDALVASARPISASSPPITTCSRRISPSSDLPRPLIKDAARAAGATAQVAGGVPAMCDGVTQGQTGMELSLFSRDVIALAAGVALSHNTFDAAVYLGVCDKIVPGLVIAAATFGHLPGGLRARRPDGPRACPMTRRPRCASNSPPARWAATS
jgi:phosphogluconate dehydratase